MDGDIAIFQCQNFGGIVCNEVDMINIQCLEHGPRTLKLSQVIGISKHFIGGERINALGL